MQIDQIYFFFLAFFPLCSKLDDGVHMFISSIALWFYGKS